ncbi:arylsulfotransferase [Aspergillus eucalypticola CBS 122712]|uniref:Arylsulfotransferase n=1 Tax=Aspergillus eucalypticola (strain CBS 122712 / IBT 29274) TaxID=1448314 RepID=A0A317VPW6_ASPEC|nr:arylsulfotransferase [Aspergillus eucalypticola CBS 122712]PWY75975.1 arylsulfotransferase [Aspergillus eucalypticola CBS 122712]
MRSPWPISASVMLLPLVAADWQFKSRPDLAPPKLNITIPAAADVEKGYLFVAPFAGIADGPGEMHGPRQASPYIFRDDGELVWSGYSYYSIWATNFQKARWNGKDVLFCFEGDHNPVYGHGHGHVTFLDQHYETIRELRAGNHKIMDKHEFHVINEETALIQIYQPMPMDLTSWGASAEQQWIVDAIIQELDIATGDVLFEWSSLDHVLPDEAILPINPGQAGAGYNSSDAWDYFHINSVDKDTDGNYLISARDACAVHKIDGSSGEIIWRLGGVKSDFELGPNVNFCFQHHARFVSKDGDSEIISLYDNSAHGTENGRGHEVHTHPFSQGKIIKVNTATWKASIVQAFQPPDGLLSKSQGGTQLLPNGNVLVNWGSEGALTEFRPDGTPILHAYMDSGSLGEGVENYRAFRYNWTGLPNETPAIVSLQNDQGTTLYVSWNGDTETKVWRFYSVVDEYGSREFLGDAKRTGFETALSLPGRVIHAVSAEAIDARGRVLTATAAVRTKAEVLPPKAASVGKHEHGAVQSQVQMGGSSHWEEYMILKLDRFSRG